MPANVSLLNLPIELLLEILSYVLGGKDKKWVDNIIDKKAVSSGPISKENANMPMPLASSADKNFPAVYQTCKAFRALLRPYNLAGNARQLLLCILESKEAQTLNIATLNPELLFTKVIHTVREYAAGLEEETNEQGQVMLRSVPQEYCNIMPLRALMVVEDGGMLNKLLPIIKNYIDKVTEKNGLELAREQWQAQFDHPPANPFDFSKLVNAITADQNLRNGGNANPANQEALKKFRQHFKPRMITEASSHHHFSMHELIRALKVYDDNWVPWNGNQLDYFWCHVIGGSQRLLSTIDAQWLCQKNLSTVLEAKQNCSHELEIENWITGAREYFYPLDSNLDCRLGVHFGVVNYGGDAGRGGVGGRDGWDGRRSLRLLEKYVEQKHQDLTALSNTLNSQLIVQSDNRGLRGSA